MKQKREIFSRARRIPAGPEREAYLDEACADEPDLRAEVAKLLETEVVVGDFLNHDVVGKAVGQPEELLGRTIGQYRLVEYLGEGGFGDVYRVEQLKPIHRELAMKIIKPGMASREIESRFLCERETLALMSHPNIAQIHDAGTTSDGRLYFIMDLAVGVPITKYCDDHQLPLHDRLNLFLTVCSAVQHAHQKGVLHRDLKPSNIVVLETEDKAHPKIIDFGIAKVLSGELKKHALMTQEGLFVGTPAYMSPEQVSMSSDTLDTRSDIYSLGVLLYELIAGVQPFEQDTLQRAALAEVQRIICEEDPDKPSSRLRKIGEKSKIIAQKRSADTTTLVRTIKGDLDWIVMRAIEKDRNRRYQGIGELASDIQRHMAHQPIEAAAPGTYYRMKKFVRRHYMGAIMVSVIVPVVVVGLIVSLVGFQRASAERDHAIAAEFVSQVEAAKASTFREHLLTLLVGEQESRRYLMNMDLIFGNIEYKNDVSGKDLIAKLKNLAAKADQVLEESPVLLAQTYGLLADSFFSLGLKIESWHLYDKMIETLAKVSGSESIPYADGLVRYAQSINYGYIGHFTLDGSGYPERFNWLLVYQGREKEIALLKEAMDIYHRNNHLSDSVIAALSQLSGAIDRDNPEKEKWMLELVESARKHYGPDDYLTLLCETPYWLYLTKNGRHKEAEPFWRKFPEAMNDWDDGPYWYPFHAGVGPGLLKEAEGDYEGAEAYYRDNIEHIESKKIGEYSAAYRANINQLLKLQRSQGNLDNEILEKLDFREYLQGFDPTKSRVDYKVKISQTGTYRLFLRWNGHNRFSNSVCVRIRHMMDGFQGEIADFYGFYRRPSFGDEFITLRPDWVHAALFERSVAWMPQYEFVEAEWLIAEPGEYTLQIMESRSGAAVDAFVLQLNSLPDPEPANLESTPIDANRCYTEINGRVVVEAEDFTERHSGRVTDWIVIPDEQDPAFDFSDYSGRGYLNVLPETDWIGPARFE